MRGQAVWAAMVVVLQVLGCCWAFGSYPGTFYQMMLRLNKERKYARTAPSPSRLWAFFNPAATLGSLSNVPLDSNRVVRRDLEPRQVQSPTSQEPPTVGSQPLGGGSELPSGESQTTTEGQEHTSGGSESTSGRPESTSGGFESTNKGSKPTEPTNGETESANIGSEAVSGMSGEGSELLSEGSQPTNGEPNGGSDSITGESETTSEERNPTEPTSEVTEPINDESIGVSESAEPTTEGSNTTSGELEPTSSASSAVSGGSEHEGKKVVCGEELVMPSPPASLTPTQGFTIKQNVSTPGWDNGHYPEDVECVWSLKVGPECEVGLLLYQVVEGEVLQSPRCIGDYLEFVQPNSHATRYCGPLVNNRDKVSGIDSWHSSQERTTTIRFRSEISRSLQDRAMSGAPRGFLMEVTYYCWLYNKEVTASTRENEVSGDGGQQHNEGRKEGSENNWKRNDKESEGNGHDNSGDESLI